MNIGHLNNWFLIRIHPIDLNLVEMRSEEENGTIHLHMVFVEQLKKWKKLRDIKFSLSKSYAIQLFPYSFGNQSESDLSISSTIHIKWLQIKLKVSRTSKLSCRAVATVCKRFLVGHCAQMTTMSKRRSVLTIKLLPSTPIRETPINTDWFLNAIRWLHEIPKDRNLRWCLWHRKTCVAWHAVKLFRTRF